MRSFWFGDVDGHGCTKAEGDLEALASRLSGIRTNPDEIVPPRWEQAVECGAVRDRKEYLNKLRKICIRVARDRVAAGFRGKDTELIQMVMLLEGMDQAINQIGERAADWYRILHPVETWKYRTPDSRRLLAGIGKDADGPLKEALDGILALRGVRTRLAREIAVRSAEVLPNCSALVGGLVAARLVALAGGLPRLARLPASSIQVLGAKGALFSHLTRGTPPPKHGIIFQHKRVHNAPGDARGRVARALAGRLAIAARIDEYRGAPDPGFLEESDRMIESAGGRR
ncbi:MAG TPA: RNA-processing protein [Methanomicrobiales archaeon]|jgi:nucleolar protein 56|nr:RNA-processing protein [Methanomicrobiales archaeon]